MQTWGARVNKTSTGKVALIVVVASESVFFLTLLTAYVALRGQVPWAMPHTVARLAIPVGNMLILLGSVVAARRTQAIAQRRQQDGLARSQIANLALGVLFVAGQVLEFTHAGMRIDDQAFGGVFFALMGFHGLHVAAGLMMLAIGIVRARLPDFSAADAQAIEIGSQFWYYVAAVWVVLFLALYLM
jgi:heme/copper-type cytochrome/quinol oxidase subunit 3